MLFGCLETALCLEMGDCFLPGSLLNRLTDASLKSNPNRSTLPPERCCNKSPYTQGFHIAKEKGLPVMYLRREENRLVRQAAICMFPLDLFFPLTAPQAPAGNGTNNTTTSIQLPSTTNFPAYKLPCKQAAHFSDGDVSVLLLSTFTGKVQVSLKAQS